jgi:type I restriction enzyme S subunit
MEDKLKQLWMSAGGSTPTGWSFVSLESLLLNPKSMSVGVMYPGKHFESGAPLIKVSDVKNGGIASKPDFCVSPSVDDEYKRTRIKGQELLITLVGNPGDCVIVTDEMVGWNAARALAVLTLKDPSIRHWLRIVLLSSPSKHIIDSRLNTTVQKTLNLKDIRELPIPIPPVSLREELCSIDSTLERKCLLNHQTNQTLEQMAQILFKSWFVDFDPVFDNLLAKADFKLENLASDFPEALLKRAQKRLLELDDKAKTALLAANSSSEVKSPVETSSEEVSQTNIHQHFPSEFEHNEQLGWIPKGWEVSELSQLINIKHGYAFKGEYFSDDKTNDILLTPGNVCVGGGFKSAKYKYYNGPIVEEYIFKEGDVYLNMTDLSKASDTLGYPAVVPEIHGVTFHHNQRLGKVLYKENGSSKKEFIYQVLCSHQSRNNVLASATGTTVKHTSPTKILSLSICHSGGIVEGLFENYAQALYEKTATNNLNNIGLTKLRDTLLPKLISGEITLPGIELSSEG